MAMTERERRREKYYANVDENRRKAREYQRKRLSNPAKREEYKARQKEWRANQSDEYHQGRLLQQRSAYYKRVHGISIEERDALLEAQNYCCALCNGLLEEDFWKTHLDHDHVTGVVRSVLCRDCNLLLGFAKESVEVLAKAIDYLHAHKVVSDVG